MTSSRLLGRGALAAILAAGCLLTPTAMARSGGDGSAVGGPPRANVYVPPSPDTATPQRDVADLPEAANVYIAPTEAGLPVSRRPAPTRSAPTPDDAGPWPVIGLALGCALLFAGAGVAVVRGMPREGQAAG